MRGAGGFAFAVFVAATVTTQCCRAALRLTSGGGHSHIGCVSNAAHAPIFEAVIVPHRSLSRRGRWLVVGFLGLICGINAAIFVHLGAWPVGGFAGGEVLLAAVMLTINAQRARASEVVLLTEHTLHITRTDPAGRRQERSLPTGWLRVALEETPGRVPRLMLQVGRAREEIATSLGEAEKRDLAAALAQALHRWRSPVFDNPQLREPEPPPSVRGSYSGSLPSERIRS